MSTDWKRTNIRVRGSVQGVYFRDKTQQRAEALGLTGWVRNDPDGSVRIVAEGEQERLRELVEWCRRGPKGAEVKNVEVEWGEEKGEFEEFEIRY